MIIGIHAVLLGFAFALGGFVTIAAPTTEESDALRRSYELARSRSWSAGLLESLRQTQTARVHGLSLFVEHWPDRPQGRRTCYISD